MASSQKFLFDVSFDAPEQIAHREAIRKPPEPTFSRAELEAARAAGVAEGRAAAQAAALQSAEFLAAGALDQLARAAQALLDERDATIRECERQTLGLVRAIVGKALPVLARRDPLGEVEALVSACLAEQLDEPRLVLRVSDALFDGLKPRLAGLAAASAFAGKLVLLADPAFGPADCRVEWADGGAERNAARLLAEIEATLARSVFASNVSSSEETPP